MYTITVSTTQREEFIDITREVAAALTKDGIQSGICLVYTPHTTAAITINENADPTVRGDLERIMARLVPDGDPLFQHTQEGPDDMSAHVRSILTSMDLSLPVIDGRPGLGTWQGIYLWEHRTHAHRRHVTLTLYGE